MFRKMSLFGMLVAVLTVVSSGAKAQGGFAFKKKSLQDKTSFAFHSKSGVFRVYKLGKVIEEKADNSLRNGSLRFLILGPGQARIIGNNGAGKVKLYRTKSSVSFVETTPGGGQHIFTVYDEWDEKAKGFRATYIRTVPNPILNEVMRTTYKGHAK